MQSEHIRRISFFSFWENETIGVNVHLRGLNLPFLGADLTLEEAFRLRGQLDDTISEFEHLSECVEEDLGSPSDK